MSPTPCRLLLGLVLAGALVWGSTLPADGQACNSAPTANDDHADHLGEAVVIDALANDTDADGEALTITISAWTCQGTVVASLGLVTLLPFPAAPEDCTINYQISDERGGTDSAVIHVHKFVEIFADGFESGDASAWSSCEPACL